MAGPLSARVLEGLVDWDWAAAPPRVRHSRRASLAGGHAGLAVFFGYVYRDGRRAEDLRSARAHIQQAFEIVDRYPTMGGLWDGVLGIAWAASHLHDVLGEQDTQDPAAAADDLLAEMLGAVIGSYDLVGGLVG